ncbi:MAG TPA: transglutaminase [Planctomycetaceae bacterium]|nr:transglutaminase [Planctomycetaceae bacterium]
MLWMKVGRWGGILLVTLAWLAASPKASAQETASSEVTQALTRAGDNRRKLERALAETSGDERRGMEFLIANMPDSDLQSLSAEFLLENSNLAWKARRELPWGKQIPEAIFFNNVLPYANVDEKRDPWRKDLMELCLPIAKECQTPSEAAQRLNSEVFPKLKLGYSTQRKAPNQSPKESIEQGKASCTGLSIVLSDACRAVCIPARLVGTPLWANKRGNHTWVEIWDGDWHFTGACEPDKNGLNRGWFIGDAAQARKDSFEHAIYAASFARTKQHFPLVWAMRNKNVPAENVTDRYARPADADKSTVLLLVRVLDGERQRVVKGVRVISQAEGNGEQSGESRGETADLNDILKFEVQPGADYVVKVGDFERKVRVVTDTGELIVEIVVP